MPNKKTCYFLILWEDEGIFLQPISTLVASKRREGLPCIRKGQEISLPIIIKTVKKNIQKLLKSYLTGGYLKTTYYNMNESLHSKDRNQETRWGITHKISVAVDTESSKKRHDQTLMQVIYHLHSTNIPTQSWAVLQARLFSLTQLWGAWDIIVQEMPSLSRLGYSSFFRNP